MSISYELPASLSKENTEKMFRRFLLFLDNKDPFIGCPDEITTPLQVLVLTFENDQVDFIKDMFHYVQEMNKEGFRSVEAINDLIEVSFQHEDGISEEDVLELMALRDFILGKDVYNFFVAKYLMMMKGHGFDYTAYI